jgi:hypothetical protein
MIMFFSIFAFAFLVLNVMTSITVLKKINRIDSRFGPLYRKNEEIIQIFYKDIEGIEKTLVCLCEKVQVLPDIVKDDNLRSMQKILELLDSAKPIKTNNWDSVREAFKAPVRTDNVGDRIK